jgi:hypothetical protein
VSNITIGLPTIVQAGIVIVFVTKCRWLGHCCFPGCFGNFAVIFFGATVADVLMSRVMKIARARKPTMVNAHSFEKTCG